MKEEILQLLKYQYEFIQKSSSEMESELFNLDKFGDFVHSFNIFLDKNDKYFYMLEGENLSKLVDILLFGRREYRLRLTPCTAIQEATLLTKLDNYYQNDNANKDAIGAIAIKKERDKLGIKDPNIKLSDIIIFNYRNIDTLINSEKCVGALSSNPTFLHTTLFMLKYFPCFYSDSDILDTTREIISEGSKFYNRNDRKNAREITKELDKMYPTSEKILEIRKFW